MAIKLFQHKDAPEWKSQIQNYALSFGDPTRWRRNNTWDGQIGWTQTLPTTLVMPSNDMGGELEVRKRIIGDGGHSYAQGIGQRVLEISGDVLYDDPADAFEFERQIKSWAVRPFLKLSYRDDCYINLGAFRGISWKQRPVSGRRMNHVRITWQLDDPFWYENTLTKLYRLGGSTYFVMDPLLNVDPSKCFHPVRPVIEVRTTADAGHTDVGSAPLGTGIVLYNYTEGGINCSISAPGLAAGQKLVVDMERGTVTEGTDGSATETNMASVFTGEMFHLYPGDNSVAYSGSFAYLTFKFRNRWT